MSNNSKIETLAVAIVQKGSDSSYIQRLFSECVYEKIKEKLKTKNQFVFNVLEKLEQDGKVSLLEKEEDQSDKEASTEPSEDEPVEDEPSDGEPVVEYGLTDFDPGSYEVAKLISLAEDVDGISDEDKERIESFLSDEIDENETQELLASIYGDGTWADEIDLETFEAVPEDDDSFTDAKMYSTPTDGIFIVLVPNADEKLIDVYAAKSVVTSEE